MNYSSIGDSQMYLNLVFFVVAIQKELYIFKIKEKKNNVCIIYSFVRVGGAFTLVLCSKDSLY